MIIYFLLFFGVILADRISKFFALHYLPHSWQLNKYLTFVLGINRGVSWGLFHSTSNYIFWLVTAGIIGLTAILIFYTVDRFKHGKSIIGEILVIAGSVSNIIDRFYYSGVVDFILLSYDDWQWPVFNVADASIVIGVFIMVYQHWKKG